MNILDRFLKYVSISTNSDSESSKNPSTESQKEFAKILFEELKQMHLDEVYLDEKYCYVYGVLNGNENFKKIGFVSHMDTAEAVTDINVKPQIIRNYNGETVHLNETEVLDVKKYPDLKNHIGKTLITTDGSTLLGADDKAGIAEIMTMLEDVIKNNTPHGDIFVAFTPDEEIGSGAEFIDFSRFKPDFAYTVDGSSLGEISFENFNAASIKIEINGVSTHLGDAKNILVNSQLIANKIINQVPEEFPEGTEKYEGYYHLDSINGDVQKTRMKFLIRDFDKENFEKRKNKFIEIVNKLNIEYNNCIEIKISDTYYNMKEKIMDNMHIIENAKNAMENVGVTPLIKETRGGTDGAEITNKGIPCPNLGTGGHNFHSIYEYICCQDMEKTAQILTEIIKIYAK